mmetsp:Transcript_22425/g.44011  ORF Transcript_22425/g.44011 Transcript_22425/m.44011 type:complete len:492 (+) Transcript_22425:37-1512(+)|eukprot:CAMPEP_0171555594 /NCGR_PEP_ID=MMETSP0960-20121227/10235_1 /TAXON_ID=87120 /ORGANISM="Aurantiochytrium limacinum, Strain ATCCMYA-1381" /LENGTH=491 /DNA_ID=CAMNT_0012105715 /DNA_START=12 /DNA_END=1487 /DNA_ORIENTATION=+
MQVLRCSRVATSKRPHAGPTLVLHPYAGAPSLREQDGLDANHHFAFMRMASASLTSTSSSTAKGSAKGVTRAALKNVHMDRGMGSRGTVSRDLSIPTHASSHAKTSSGLGAEFPSAATHKVQISSATMRPRAETSRLQKIQEALVPYRVGLRKFFTNISVAYDLIKSSVVDINRRLTRREKRLVVRTVLDLAKLIPFAIIAAAPGGSLLLPVMARYLPSTLPTTFNMPPRKELEKIVQTSEDEKDFKRQMDRDLKRAMESMVSSMHKNQIAYYKEVRELLEEATRVESLGGEASPVLIAKISDADLLDILNLAQLERLADYFHLSLSSSTSVKSADLDLDADVSSSGSPTSILGSYRFTMLRYHLSRHIAKLDSEDVLLAEEGIGSLADEDLVQACQARGLVPNSLQDGIRFFLENDSNQQQNGEGVTHVSPSKPKLQPLLRSELATSLNMWLLGSVGRHVPLVILAFRNFDAQVEGSGPSAEAIINIETK